MVNKEVLCSQETTKQTYSKYLVTYHIIGGRQPTIYTITMETGKKKKKKKKAMYGMVYRIGNGAPVVWTR